MKPTPTATTKTTATTTTNGSRKAASMKSRQIRDYNEIFLCYLCGGYMIDPTTVDNCAHTYCRSCILKHLLKSAYCPQCGTAGKSINANNLGSDKILRSLIYKMVPGLYQSERERYMQFYICKKSDDDTKLEPDGLSTDEEDEFFMATEPISLSLEYDSTLLEDCPESDVPPVRYLQCPASVQIQHLKRFLYSKFALDPHNGKILVEIIYEDEILPDNFTLMDVGYCFNWRREAPMRFIYRILVYSETPNTIENLESKSAQETKTMQHHQQQKHHQKAKPITQKSHKSVSFANETTTFESENMTKVGNLENVKCTKLLNDRNNDGNQIASMKVVITRKTNESKTKSSGKRSHNNDEPVAPTNDFKSLRSNDIRFSDYTVTSSPATATGIGKQHGKTSSSSAGGATGAASKIQSSMRLMSKTSSSSSSSAASLPPQAAVVPIVVSIPQSQVAKSSSYALDENIDNLSLAQLKNACKKSPNFNLYNSSSSSSSPPPPQTTTMATKNVPKLKIELGSLKTKLTIPKPKSADAVIDNAPPPSKKAKYRKHSLDLESGPITGKVDLETYAKNIGLKPIEVVTSQSTFDNLEANEKTIKYSPNASPMSSCSSSTTTSSSSNGGGSGGNISNNIDGGHSSHSSHSSYSTHSGHSHKKHKKKHSKTSKESKEGKRRKLHAEISSQPADESLKMKVKITSSSVPHSHKTHKSKTTPSSIPIASNSSGVSTLQQPKSPPKSPKPPKSPPNLNFQQSTSMAVVSSINSLSLALPTPSLMTTTPTASTLPPPPPPPPMASSTKHKLSPKPDSNAINIVALNKTLGEEAQSINKLMCEKTPGEAAAAPATSKSATQQSHLVSHIRQQPPQLLPKPVVNVKESQKLPTSPPLPPSLFKTMPLTFATLPSSSSSSLTFASNLRPAPPPPTPTSSMTKSDNFKSKQQQQQQSKSQPFAVPNPPRPKHFAAPSSIASSINKQAANYLHLKRSASLDDASSSSSSPSSSSLSGPLSKQQRLEQDRLLRKTAYGPTLSSLPASAAKLLQQQFQSKDEKNRTITDTGLVDMPPFYAPLMTQFGTLSQRRPTGGVSGGVSGGGVSSPPLNITKLNDAILKSTGLMTPSPSSSSPSTSSSLSSLTSTNVAPMGFNARLPPTFTQAQLNLLAAAPFQQLPLMNKSPLEVMRLSAPIVSTEAVTLPPLSPPKPIPNRLMGPPISTGNKIRKPAPLSPSTLAAVKMANFQATSSSTKATVVSSPPLTSPSNANLAITSTSPPTSNLITTTTTSAMGQKLTINNTSNNNNNNIKKTTFRSSPPALINFRNTVPLKPAAAAKPALPSPPQPETGSKIQTKTNEHAKSNGIADKLKSTTTTTTATTTTTSLRDFRPVSKDNSSDILDLSGGHKISPKDLTSRILLPPPLPLPLPSTLTLTLTSTSTSATSATAAAATAAAKNLPISMNSVGNSLEAALNKMKQSITTCTVTNVDAAKTSNKSLNSDTSTDDLQNLHLLSESATAREKIAIKSQSLISTTNANINPNVNLNSNASTLSATHQSIYDKPKHQQQSTLVRQQNASVRNIPNPSALAFRNQQLALPLPTSSTANLIATTAATTTAAAATTTTATIQQAPVTITSPIIASIAATTTQLPPPPAPPTATTTTTTQSPATEPSTTSVLLSTTTTTATTTKLSSPILMPMASNLIVGTTPTTTTTLNDSAAAAANLIPKIDEKPAMVTSSSGMNNCNTSAMTTTTTTTLATPTQIRPTKKLTTIDQVAATLNIRAAAAEASAARAASAAAAQDETNTVNLTNATTTIATTINATTTTAAATTTTTTIIAANNENSSNVTSSSSTVEIDIAASISTPKMVETCETSTPTSTSTPTPTATPSSPIMTPTTTCKNTETLSTTTTTTTTTDMTTTTATTTTTTTSTENISNNNNNNNNKNNNSRNATNTGNNNNNTNNNNNDSQHNNNNNKTNSNNGSNNNNNNNNNNDNSINNITPASTSAPLSTSLSSSSSSSALLSESNQTSLVVQGSI